MLENYSQIEKIIGYEFKNIEFLVQAFTHNSYSTTKHTKSYQQLEFLGDSILDFVVAKILIERYPEFPEGKLTKLRAQIVSEAPLSGATTRLGIEKFMLLGNSEKKQNVNELASVKADLFESVVGAIYSDSNSIECAEKFVQVLLNIEIENANVEDSQELDAKSKINEYALKHGYSIEYVLKKNKGPDHAPIFSYSVLIDGKQRGVGSGHNKKEAQQSAAKSAITKLKI
ncbi:MAG TPA: ribonuclease III [Clostridia bacterium]|nr:ribonuclease III [Clostridia bacterium]